MVGADQGGVSFWLALIQGPEKGRFRIRFGYGWSCYLNLQDPSGSYVKISSLEEHDGVLYLGSPVEDTIGRLPVPQTNLSQ